VAPSALSISPSTSMARSMPSKSSPSRVCANAPSRTSSADPATVDAPCPPALASIPRYTDIRPPTDPRTMPLN
jgi:hypothetical protein